MADEIEETFDKLKAGAKAVAKKVTDPDKDLGEQYEKEKEKERIDDYEHTDESGSQEPMSPDEINSHEPTAVNEKKSSIHWRPPLGLLFLN